MRWVTALRIAALGAWVLAAPALAQDVELRLRPLGTEAIAGLPVVVELQVVNTTSRDVETYELTDPSIARIFWTWRTASGRTHEVRMREYHFSVVPEPMFPRKVTIPPHGQLARVHTVPTPTDFPGGETWSLAVRVRDPLDQSVARAEVEYVGRAPAEPPVMGKIDPSLAQAALLEYSREDVLEHGLDATSLDAVREASEQGERVAKLIVVSRRIKRGEEATAEWDALERDRPEVRAVRNSLLLDDLTRAAERHRLPSARRVRLAKRVRPEEPLHREIREALRSGHRARTQTPPG